MTYFRVISEKLKEAYQPKDVSGVIYEILDFLYYEEKILMINTLSCMLSTAITASEVDKLSEGMLKAFRKLKPNIDNLHKG